MNLEGISPNGQQTLMLASLTFWLKRYQRGIRKVSLVSLLNGSLQDQIWARFAVQASSGIGGLVLRHPSTMPLMRTSFRVCQYKKTQANGLCVRRSI